MSDRAFAIGEALHTYFAVSDVRATKILGLDGCGYLDKVDGGRRKRQSGPVVIGNEVDRVYPGTEAECAIEDPGFGRRIHTRRWAPASCSRSTARATRRSSPFFERAGKRRLVARYASLELI